jgi:hypothetical protein
VTKDPGSERALALLLGEVLADEPLWRELAAPRSDPSTLLAVRAVELYLTTGRVLEEDLDLDPEAPMVRAIAALRGIADVASVVSYERTAFVKAGGVIPPQSAFEWLIRVENLDDWAAELGCRLPLRGGAELPDEVWPRTDPPDGRISTTDFLETWTQVSGTYGGWLARFDDDARFGEHLSSMIADGSPSVEQFREGAAGILRTVRALMPWARRNLPADAEPVAVAALLISQSLFVLGWHTPAELLPSPAYLSEMLRDSGALDWLRDQGEDEPEWLT